MTEVLTILVGVLLIMTFGAAVEYYRQLHKVQREYKKARGVIEDVVWSFNCQLRREAEKLETFAGKVEATSSRGLKALERTEGVEGEFHILDTKINVLLENRQSILTRIDEIDKKLRQAVSSHQTLTTRISEIEEQAQQFPLERQPGIKAVIPIKREKALAPLTETQLSVLETLALEGPRTAPDIKLRIGLSREHTARLMKRLYEEGYLERDTSAIPFKYSIKKEMEKLLENVEHNVLGKNVNQTD